MTSRSGQWGKTDRRFGVGFFFILIVVESRFGHMTLMADHGSIDEALRACQAKLR